MQRNLFIPERNVITALNGIVLDTTSASTFSSIIPVNSYNKALLILDVDVTGTVTSLSIKVQFSSTNTTSGMHNYEMGAIGSLYCATTSMDYCVLLDVPANYMRLMLDSTGCSVTAFYSVTVKMILNAGL